MKKIVCMTVGMILIAVICIAGIKEMVMRDGRKACRAREAPVSSVEQYEGQIYDRGRLQAKDMMELMEQDKEKYGYDRKGRINAVSDKKMLELQEGSGAWYKISEGEKRQGIRYYKTDTAYVLGWRLLKRNGEFDWYYFDEDTGFMVTDTVIDGAFLSKKGYASAVAAGHAQTLETAEETMHCSEIMLIRDIEILYGLEIEKEMTYLTATGSCCRIEATDHSVEGDEVLRVTEDAEFCIGKGVAIDTRGNCRTAVTVEKNASFDCFGKAGNFSKTESGIGIEGVASSSRIRIYDGAVITGNASGIVNQGITDIEGGIITANGTQEVKKTYEKTDYDMQTASVRILPALVYAKDQAVISGERKREGNAHGIHQTGGILNMRGGMIWGNGRLGSTSDEGSFGGGVLLSGSSVMHMSGGVIAANRASAGGGIYVSPGSSLYVTGGRIGGKDKYYESAENNTPENGNYARESRVSANKKKYRGGEGGGIYSLGTVILKGENEVQIDYNCTKGAGGGGGINAAGGTLYLQGKVSISHNRTLSSDADSASLLFGGGDANGEGGGIRIGQENGSSGKCYINCDSSGVYIPGAGSVRINQNSASGDGGGIFESSDSANVLYIGGDTYIQKNQCGIGGGGGVKSLGGDLSLKDTVISENHSGEGNHGGGVLTAGKTFISGCRIFRNSSTRAGGGVCFYDSSVGTSGRGNIWNTEVYENTAVTNGAGIMMGSSKGTVTADEIKVYNNKGTKDGIRCQAGSTMHLEKSLIWGNSRYGISSSGRVVVSGKTRIGWSEYSPLKKFREAENRTGGIYNTGEFFIIAPGSLLVFSGKGNALNNTGGTVVFESQSFSLFSGYEGKDVVTNTGKIIVEKGMGQSEETVQIYGKDSKCGLYNNGGFVSWNGYITGNLKYGIYNANAGRVEIQEQGKVDSCQCGMYIKKGSEIRMKGGTILECGKYGIYVESDGRLCMEGKTYVDRNSVVFLERESFIQVTGPLEGSSKPIAVLDTAMESDRNPGRVLVRVSIAGKTAGDILGQEEEQTFGLAYAILDTGEKALLRGGEKISKDKELGITDNDIILSTHYLISYDSGYRTIDQAKKEDIILEQQEVEKFWMEDVILDLSVPNLVNAELRKKDWTFRYWEGTDHVIYSQSKAIYEKNEDLVLHACWKRDYTCYLDGWLYNRSLWMRDKNKRNKAEEIYLHFLAGDTGIITFNCRNVEDVRIVWPNTGAADELKTYDLSGNLVREQRYHMKSLTKDLDTDLCYEKYQFRVPLDTPEGVYQVRIEGRSRKGEQLICPLLLYVEDRKITSEIRTRIR